MIIFGIIMAVAAGLALPGHMLLFGEVINIFVFHDIATATAATAMNPSNMTQPAHFCFNSSSSGDITSNLLPYFGDPSGTLLSEVGRYSLYYVGLATATLIATFLATMFWNFSAYRQTRRMRQAFYQSILRQDIGWFDVTEANELSTRLAE